MDFFEFLDGSVTPYHTVEFLRKALESAGFKPFSADGAGALAWGGAYYAIRGGALVAFRLPQSVLPSTRVRLAVAHTDFPALKITPNPDGTCAGVCTLHPEVYGSPLFTSWLDRDLGYAGLLAVERDGKLSSRMFRGSKLFRIPQLAIHMNRGVNQEGLKLNPQQDLNALWSQSSSGLTTSFAEYLQRELAPGERLLEYDVQLFDAQPAALGGALDEWIYSGRLDNLSSCHAVLEAIASAPASMDFAVAGFFNNEEVGSMTREGAEGEFLRSILAEIWNALKVPQPLSTVLVGSLALSIDMAHAEHPNHPEKHDPGHAPVLGGGVVVKLNSQKRYASDVMSCAALRLLAESAGVPLQMFVMKNDMPCGSTVGPAISASLGIPTVDIGEPMLSMHSIREMTAVKDHQDMIKLVKTLFAVNLA